MQFPYEFKSEKYGWQYLELKDAEIFNNPSPKIYSSVNITPYHLEMLNNRQTVAIDAISTHNSEFIFHYHTYIHINGVNSGWYLEYGQLKNNPLIGTKFHRLIIEEAFAEEFI